MTEQIPLALDDAPKQRKAAALQSFHVQSHVTAAEAIEGERKAQKQEDEILTWFRTTLLASMRWTPSEVAARFPQWPITSVRRAITNLTKRGLLTHHKADRRPGPYGAKESTWSLA